MTTMAVPLGKVFNARPAEVGAALAAFAYHFLLFTSYYILRPVRDSMGIEGGVRDLELLFWWVFGGMLIAVPLFGWISSRYRRAVFLPWTYIFFIVNLLAFWAAFRLLQDDLWAARIFFVWVSVFNLFVVSVFWSFMADTFSGDQGKRLFALIAGGASMGAVTGSATTAFLAEQFGDFNLLLISDSLLAVTLAPMRWLMRWKGGTNDLESPQPDSQADQALGGNPFSGIGMVFRSGYLGGIALFVLCLVSVSTILYMQQAELLGSLIPDRSERTGFLARIDLVVNLCALGLQLLAVGRFVKRLGLSIMLPLVPLVMILGFTLLASYPGLWILVAVYVARRIGEYAVAKPCREMLFTAVPREAKYKSKNFIDTVVYRGGDALSATAHGAAVSAFGLGLAGVAWLGAFVASLWAVLAFALGRERDRRQD